VLRGEALVQGRWLVLGLALIVAVAGSPAGAASAPAFDRTIGGPLHAQIYPSGAEVAPNGDLVVADTGNDQVVRFNPSGTQVWRVGTPGAGLGQFSNPRDIGIDSAGNIFVADADNERIVMLDGSGHWVRSWGSRADGVVGTVIGISVTNNLVYAAAANRIRIFTESGSVSATIRGTSCAFGAPRDVAVASNGHLFVANYSQENILELSPTGTCLHSWGTLGTGNGQFRHPYGVTVRTDPLLGTDAVYVADSNNDRIQEFRTDGTWVATIGGPGQPSQNGTFTQLRRVAVAADGSVWGADLWGWRMERFARSGSAKTTYVWRQTIGTPLPPPTSTAVFQEPHQVAFEADGTIDVMDTVHQQLVRFTPAGQLIGTCGQRGGTGGSFNWPRGVAVDQASGQIWIADTKQDRIQILKPDCSVVKFFGTAGTGTANFDWPFALAIRPGDHTAWVADTYNNRIKVYDVATRSLIGTFSPGSGSTPFVLPGGIAVSPANGHVFVADSGNNRIVELTDKHGTGISVVRSYTDAFNNPQGVAVDAAGRIYVADTGHSQVVILTATGSELTRFSGPNGLDAPADVAIDAAGRLDVTDTFNDRIQRYAPYTG
jgi:DNA-binding beta-propeller fold protein YncE